MADANSVIERLKKYCSANPQIVSSGYIKGIDPATSNIVIEKDGATKNITIDELESNSWLNNQPTEESVEVMEEISEPEEVLETIANEPIEVMEEPAAEPQPVAVDNNVSDTIENAAVLENLNVSSTSISTLKNMQDAISAKDEAAVNKALETFAIDEKTGTININKAIKIITDNSTNNVVECVRNNTELPTDLTGYDITGKIIAPLNKSETPVNLDKLIDDSFNCILVYVQAAKLKNIVYNDSQILAAKNKYSTGVHDRLNVQGLNKTEETTSDDTTSESTVSDIKPDTDIKKAGFADVLILTIIVLIYAAIIVNLISKLK